MSEEEREARSAIDADEWCYTDTVRPLLAIIDGLRSLPVLRTCGDCGWHGSLWVGERRTGGFCAKPASGRHGDRVDARTAPKVDLDAAPPLSCPLRGAR